MDIDVQIAESLIEAFNHEETGILLWDKNDKLLYRNIDMEKRFIRLNIPYIIGQSFYERLSIIREKKYDPDNIKQLINKVVAQNSDLDKSFEGDLKSWPLYFTPQILPSTNSKVFYIGDAFNGFLPTLAQGAGQSIECPRVI